MSLLLAWGAFPALLAALAVGSGLALERALVIRLPGVLLAGVGLAILIVIGDIAALSPATAGLAAPAAAALALVGLALGARARLRRPRGWALGVAAATLAAYSAPIVASGEATFAGYIRLDDTATWMALADRIAEHGRSVDGLAPSTYEATLAFNLGEGYPIGAFVPLAIGATILGEDVAWVIQPYMALGGALLALAIWALVAPLVADQRLRAAACFVGAQPALLFGYYLWGGVKEVIAAVLIATVAALVAVAAREGFRGASLFPLAIGSAALVSVLSPGGSIWLLPAIAVLAVAAAGSVGTRRLARSAAAPLGLGVLLAAPAIAAGIVPPTAAPLTDAAAQGNLLGPLDPAQVAGIWPAGDLRLEPVTRTGAALLVGLAVAAAAVGLAIAWRRREWGMVAFAAASLGGAVAALAIASPWVAGKALAIASPAIPVLALVAASTLVARRRRAAGIALAATLAAGVLWSNALAYRDVNLAPRDQLAELEQIGAEIDGLGPTLITEYQPYGARHFLRHGDPEAPSELRRRTAALAGGRTVPTGGSADTDELDLAGLLAYRTLVLRRGPSQSRPPSVYAPLRRGLHYEVWQRAEGAGAEIVDRLALGGALDPGAVPPCRRIRALAERAPGDGTLLAAPARATAVARLSPADYPGEWLDPEAPASPRPRTAGSIRRTAAVPAPGRYEVWLQGSVRSRAELIVNGVESGSARHRLNGAGQHVRLGAVSLPAGEHELEVRLGGADLHPGSGAGGGSVGPLALAPRSARTPALVRVDPGDAAQLCGRRWDWIEALSR